MRTAVTVRLIQKYQDTSISALLTHRYGAEKATGHQAGDVMLTNKQRCNH